jgi:hypothetical protein
VDHVLVLILHHAVSDAMSCAVLDADFRALLGAGSDAARRTALAPPMQLRAYTTWEQGQLTCLGTL